MLANTFLPILSLISLAVAQEVPLPTVTAAPAHPVEDRSLFGNLFCAVDVFGLCNDGSRAYTSSYQAASSSSARRAMSSASVASVASVSSANSRASIASISSASVAAQQASASSLSVRPTASVASIQSIQSASSLSAAQASSSMSASAAQSTCKSDLGYQQYTVGHNGKYASPITYSNGLYYVSGSSFSSLKAACSQSCSDQLSSCKSVSLWNLFLPSTSCTTQYNSCISTGNVAASSQAAQTYQSSSTRSSTSQSSISVASSKAQSSSAMSVASVAASASSASSAANAGSTSKANLALQKFNTGYASIFALPVTQGSVKGVYYSGSVPYNNLGDALTYSCQVQKNHCSIYAIANIFFPDSKCVSQYTSCTTLAKAQVLAMSSSLATSSQYALSTAYAASASRAAQSSASLASIASISFAANKAGAQSSQAVQSAQSAASLASVQSMASASSSSARLLASLAAPVAQATSVIAQVTSAAGGAVSSAYGGASSIVQVAQSSIQGAQSSVVGQASTVLAQASSIINSAIPASSIISQVESAVPVSIIAEASSIATQAVQPVVSGASSIVSSAAAAASSIVSSSTGLVFGSLPSGFSYLSSGLVAEGTTGRALTGSTTSSSDMTPAVCSSYCSSLGYAISATEYSSECYCGNSLENGAALSILSTNTPMTCSGDASLTCGAGNALQIVYDSSKVSSSLISLVGAASSVLSSATSAAVSGASSIISTAAAAASSAVVYTVGTLPSGFKSAASGLIAEGSNGRALTGASTSSSSMTPAVCASYCSNLGYGLSGTEYSSECFCGNSLSNGASLSLPSSNSGMPCSGDSSLTCGGESALTLIYDSSIFYADLSAISGAASVVASATSALESAAASATSAAVTLANGFISDLNCIAEVDGRLMKGAAFSSSVMTYELCTNFCKKAGFTQAGVEYGSECYCSSDVDLMQVSPSTQCNSPCSGDASKICGGGQALQIFTTAASTATNSALSNGWVPTTVCLADNLSGSRLFDRDSYSSDSMTQESCTDFCASNGYDQAGMEYATQCFCQTGLDLNAAITSSQCNMACAGDQTELCGGPNALTVYTAPSSSTDSKRSIRKRLASLVSN